MLLISLLAGVFMPVNGKCLIPSGSGTRGGGYGPNGKWEEPGGLVNDGFRYRDRTTSTFLTRDPAGFIDGPNDYNYVRHNPWSAFDPNGLSSVIPNSTDDIGYVNPSASGSDPPMVPFNEPNPGSGTVGSGAPFGDIDPYGRGPSVTFDPVSYALGEPGTTILDDALGSDADWVSGISQGYGFGFNYLSGVFSAAWPGAINLSGLLPIDIISNPNTTSLDLTNLAESGSYTPEVSRVLQDLSQSFSNGLHDYSILSGTTQGVAAITQPETVFVKGFTAVIIAIKGLSYVDDVVRAASKADDLIGYVALSADEGVEATAKAVAGGGDEMIDVYRAFGGDARAQGFSWTTVDPRNVRNFRDAAGLPSGGASGANNTADFLIKGRARRSDVIEFKSADPLDGNRGGLPELIIDPQNVDLFDFSVIKP
jgi:RHS repeat-associated protein